PVRADVGWGGAAGSEGAGGGSTAGGRRREGGGLDAATKGSPAVGLTRKRIRAERIATLADATHDNGEVAGQTDRVRRLRRYHRTVLERYVAGRCNLAREIEPPRVRRVDGRVPGRPSHR